MIKQKPLWERLYLDAAYIEIARMIGYRGTTYREMMKMLESLEEKFGKQRVHSAVYHIVTFEGQMTCNPKPLEEVKLRPEVRKLCWQLLGPPPDQMDAFMTNRDGSSRYPKEAASTPSETPKQEPMPVKNEPPTKKPRKKKAEPKPSEVPAEAKRPEADKTTIMDQYQVAKEKHPGMMLLFRIGDFYELFDQDAEEASKLLGLTLTTRDQTYTMAGFPHHQLEPYLQKLLKAGRRVAICDQVEDSLAREPIKREVERVIAPEKNGKVDSRLG